MKASELMIGDWVYEGISQSVKVRQNYGTSIRYDKDGYSHEAEELCLSPIPITKEILEKNGWVFNELPFVQGWEFMGLTIREWTITCGINVSMNVRYIHELQRVMRACGLSELADNFKIE